MKSLYLNGCKSGYEKYWTFIYLDDVIKLLKNKRIVEYWKSHCIQRLKDTKEYDYINVVENNDLKFNYKMFSKQNINEIYKLFSMLISISMDKDIDECINSLEAIERDKNGKK